MTKRIYQDRIGPFLLFTHAGHITAVLAGTALWLAAWPVLVPVVIAAVALDRCEARKNGR